MDWKNFLKPTITKIIGTILLFIILVVSRELIFPPCPFAGPCPAGVGPLLPLVDFLMIPYSILSLIGLALIPEIFKLILLALYFYFISSVLVFLYHKFRKK